MNDPLSYLLQKSIDAAVKSAVADFLSTNRLLNAQTAAAYLSKPVKWLRKNYKATIHLGPRDSRWSISDLNEGPNL